MSMSTQDKARFSPVRRSAMHQKHLALGAPMEERDGWQQPTHFASPEVDSNLLREGVGVCDISPQAKFVLKGDHLGQMISGAFAAASIPDVGQLSLEAPVGGGSGPRAALCRLAEDELLCVASTALAASIAEGWQDDYGQCAHALDISSGLAGVGLAGPQARRLLGMLSELDTSEPAFPNLRCAQSKVAGIHGTVLRIDLGGLPGYQVYFGREFGEYFWEAVLEAAGACGGGPVGFKAWEALAG